MTLIVRPAAAFIYSLKNKKKQKFNEKHSREDHVTGARRKILQNG